MLFCRLLIFFKINLLKKILSGIQSECQTVWTLIRPDNWSGLSWVQTVCQGHQQTTLVDKELTLKAPNTTKAEFANTVDPDETAHNEPSHLDLQCLPSSL